jgi:hypothetical protein
MRHDWIFDVLRDLLRYADANGLIELAQAVDTALAAARREIGWENPPDPEADPPGIPPKRRSN